MADLNINYKNKMNPKIGIDIFYKFELE